ncbi:MAG: DUF2130 domain-containing protein, partial [Crenarchaeota archaeon]|nr:DUF2130 domain-containing protein [Thermoproteota archaeon]
KKVEAELQEQLEKAKESARQAAIDEARVEKNRLEQTIRERNKKLEDVESAAARAREEHEAALTRKTRELEQRQAEIEAEAERRRLEEERKLREERAALQTKVREEVENQARLKEAESATLIVSLSKQIEDLRRQATQASQQLQGEAQEVALEQVLRMQFPSDIIEPVPKGFKGADCLQVVKSDGQKIGKIIWESKRTKQWLNEWVMKLKDDQRTAQAEIAIIVTQTLPTGINKAANYEGVWVTDFPTAMTVAIALRAGLVEVAKTRRMFAVSQGKNQGLFDYVTGVEFRQAIQAIVETFLTFKIELEAEKRTMERQWSKREKTIQRALTATDRIHGSLQGILGSGVMPDLQRSLPESTGV